MPFTENNPFVVEGSDILELFFKFEEGARAEIPKPNYAQCPADGFYSAPQKLEQEPLRYSTGGFSETKGAAIPHRGDGDTIN